MQADVVLGGSGFVGSNLVSALAAKNRRVFSADRSVTGSAVPNDGVEHRKLDVFNCTEGGLDDLLVDAEVYITSLGQAFPPRRKPILGVI